MEQNVQYVIKNENNENNKELWIKNNINFSNNIKSLDLMKKLYVNTDYKFMNWNQDLEKNKSWKRN